MMSDLYMFNFYEKSPEFNKIGRTVTAEEINSDYSYRFQNTNNVPDLDPDKTFDVDANHTYYRSFRGTDSLSELFENICQRESITNLHLRTDIRIIDPIHDMEEDPRLKKFLNDAAVEASKGHDPNDIDGYINRYRNITERLYDNPSVIRGGTHLSISDTLNKGIAHITCDDNNTAAIYVCTLGKTPAILVSPKVNITKDNCNFIPYNELMSVLLRYSETGLAKSHPVIELQFGAFIVPLTYYNIVKALLDLSFGCMNHRLSNVPMIHPFVR